MDVDPPVTIREGRAHHEQVGSPVWMKARGAATRHAYRPQRNGRRSMQQRRPQSSPQRGGGAEWQVISPPTGYDDDDVVAKIYPKGDGQYKVKVFDIPDEYEVYRYLRPDADGPQ